MEYVFKVLIIKILEAFLKSCDRFGGTIQNVTVFNIHYNISFV